MKPATTVTKIPIAPSLREPAEALSPPVALVRQPRRPGLLAPQHRVRRPRRRPAELLRRDRDDAALEPGFLEDRGRELGPRALAVGGDVPDAGRELHELAGRRGEVPDVR